MEEHCLNRLFAAPVALGALLLLLAAAAGLGWIWLRTGRPDHPDASHVALLLMPIALLGAAVLVWGVGRMQTAITVWVVVMFAGCLPLLVALRVGAAGAPGVGQWPFGLAYGVSWAALLVGFMLWLAPWAATVPAPVQRIAVAHQTLRARLLALQTIAPALQCEPGERSDELSVVYVFRAGKRTAKMRLRLDARHGRVDAKEYFGVVGDAPITASERQIGFMAYRAGQPVRPSASLVYSSDWSVTMPMQEKRRTLGVRVHGDAVELPPQTVAHFADGAVDGATDLPHLLAEIVHQSGWEWRGVFLF